MTDGKPLTCIDCRTPLRIGLHRKGKAPRRCEPCGKTHKAARHRERMKDPNRRARVREAQKRYDIKRRMGPYMGPRCEVDECDNMTEGGKPFCPEHVFMNPYARKVAEELRRLEAEGRDS